MTHQVEILDARAYDPRAVQIAHQLDSVDPADYRRIEDWLKAGSYADFSIDALVEFFDREMGLPGEASKHPERPHPAG